MMRPKRVENAIELLDSPLHDLDVLSRDFDNIEGVNRWLGGTRAVRLAIGESVRAGTNLRILDVGCGSGDVARAVAADVAAAGTRADIVCVDLHAQMIELARSRSEGRAIEFVRADGLRLPFADDSFDIALMSLALHHFDGHARATVLRELVRVSRERVIINELERCWSNYLGARLLAATLWRGDPLARHDGPLSVLRGFTAAELTSELAAAGLEDVRVDRRYFCRLVASGSPSRS